MRIVERLKSRNENPRASRPVLIACLGDSVTHGCFELLVEENRLESACRPWEGFTARLQKRLTMLYPAAAPTVLNAGIGGDDAEGMLRRLERDVLCFSPDLVILEAGLNDCMAPDGTRGIAQFSERIGRILDAVLASGSEALLLTPNMMCTRVSCDLPGGPWVADAVEGFVRAQNGGVLDLFVDAARKEAERRSVPIADAYRAWKAMEAAGVDTTMLLSNRINHPTPELHDLFVEEIMHVLFDC